MTHSEIVWKRGAAETLTFQWACLVDLVIARAVLTALTSHCTSRYCGQPLPSPSPPSPAVDRALPPPTLGLPPHPSSSATDTSRLAPTPPSTTSFFFF